MTTKTINIKQDPVVKRFKNYIENLKIPLVNIYLFGSHSRGEQNPDSDYDFLILINDEFPKDKIKKITREIVKNVHKIIPDTSFDIIVKKKEEFEYYKNEINTICHTVFEEGILI